MHILGLLLVLAFIGFLLSMFVKAPVPIHPWIKTFIVGIVAFAILIYVLNFFGINTGINLRL